MAHIAKTLFLMMLCRAWIFKRITSHPAWHGDNLLGDNHDRTNKQIPQISHCAGYYAA
jgi:hypothetical protein